MREISLQEYKELAYGCLKEFHRVCEEHQLRYTVAFGTLLGAVRHKGFIPWDDDIDIIMPREDYEKFVKISSQSLNPQYKLLSIETEKKFTAPLAKLIDARTGLKQHVIRDGMELGVYIDIFVFDNVSDDKKIRNSQYQLANILKKFWSYCTDSRDEKITSVKTLVKRVLFANDGRMYAQIMNMIAKRYSSVKTEYISNLMFGILQNRDAFEIRSNDFDHLISIPFESIQVKAVPSYDEILKKLYGDYMQLPPKESQITHHHFSVYWKN